MNHITQNFKAGGMGKILSAFLIVVLLSACGEDIDVFIPKPLAEVQGDIELLRERLRSDGSLSTTYSFKCPCYGGWTYALDKDLYIQIPPDFVDLTKFPCHPDGFDMQVTVADERGEMLIHGISTMSDQTLIDSRIQCKLEMFNEYGLVELRNDKSMRVLVKDADPRERMELFYRNAENNWTQIDHDPVSWNTVWPSDWSLDILDSSGSVTVVNGVGYETSCNYFDWMGISAFSNTPYDQRTQVHVQLPAGYTQENTDAYLVMLDIKSVVQLQWDEENKQFIDPNNLVTTGSGVMFVTLSNMGNDNYHFSVNKTFVESDHMEFLTPLRTPYSEIQSFLAEL